MSEEVEATPTGLGRRQFIKSSAVVGGLVWAAPAMSTLGARAYAAGTRINLCACGTDDKPRDLVWQYRPDLLIGDSQAACETGEQDGVCTYNKEAFTTPFVGKSVTIDIKGVGPPRSQTETVEPNGTFTVLGETTNLEFRVLKEGTEIHYVSVHTSCSVPLFINDRFGAFLLIGGVDNCPE